VYQIAAARLQRSFAVLERNATTVVQNDEALGGSINLKAFAGKPEEEIKFYKAVLSVYGRTVP